MIATSERGESGSEFSSDRFQANYIAPACIELRPYPAPLAGSRDSGPPPSSGPLCALRTVSTALSPSRPQSAAGDTVRLELDQRVEIAVRREIIAQRWSLIFRLKSCLQARHDAHGLPYTMATSPAKPYLPGSHASLQSPCIASPPTSPLAPSGSPTASPSPTRTTGTPACSRTETAPRRPASRNRAQTVHPNSG